MKQNLFIVCGLIGAGKTTSAQILSNLTNAPVVSVDQTINYIFEKPSNIGKDRPFNKFEIDICYKVFSLVAKHVLLAGSSIIIDGVFAKKEQRDSMILLAKKNKVSCHIIYITCPENIIKERAEKRFATGRGVGWKAYLKFKKEFEILKNKNLVVDTSKDVKLQLKKYLKDKKII